MIDLENLTIKKAREHLVKKDFSSVELTEAYRNVIEEKNSAIHAYLEVFDDSIEQAKYADSVIHTKGDDSPLLTGIPLAIKDNILIEGKTASCASKMLSSYRASYDANVIEKLKKENAIFLGRTNMDEFAMGASNEHSAFGGAKNPHDIERVPGGSSGGSAAAVAMNGALGALGSDTGGSVRQPASFCGVVGLKPTYGKVSRSGLIAMASSLDQIGTFGKTVEDTQVLFEAIAGYDPMDSTSLNTPYPKPHTLNPKVIGVPYHVLKEGVDEDVFKNFTDSVKKLEKAGYEIKEIELPYVKYSLPVYYIIMPAESSTNLARFDGVRYGLREEGGNLFEDYAETRGIGFGEEVRRRILAGTYVLSHGYYDAYYTKAKEVRGRIKKELEDVYASGIDVIATPTSPTPAFKIGEKTGSPIQMYLADIFTVPANIAGIPALSVPSGFAVRDRKELPLGIQFMAGYGEENVLFEVGKRFEICN